MKKILSRLLPEYTKGFLRKHFYKQAFSVSQAGQDFGVFGEAFNEKKNGFFVNIGAHDGINISSTYWLENRYNWSGVRIEANPHTFKNLQKNRKATCLNIYLDCHEGEVTFHPKGVMGGIVDQGLDNQIDNINSSDTLTLPTKTLNATLVDISAPKVIDYLSIDVEGAEEQILAEFDFERYTFLCITIERPSELIQTLLKDNQYLLVKTIPGLDSFYIHQSFAQNYYQNVLDFYHRKQLPSRSVSHHWAET